MHTKIGRTETIAYTTRIDFDKLPKEFRESIFVKLADIDSAVVDLANTIHRHFDKLPTGLRERLLVKLADKDTAAGEVGDALLYHFENLSEEVKLNLNIREQLEQNLSSFCKVS